jgi:hypothetical protein
MDSDAAYSMRNTGLGASICDFGEAWGAKRKACRMPARLLRADDSVISCEMPFMPSREKTEATTRNRSSSMDWRIDIFSAAPDGWVR